jgi:hypothetical protein
LGDGGVELLEPVLTNDGGRLTWHFAIQSAATFELVIDDLLPNLFYILCQSRAPVASPPLKPLQPFPFSF